MFSRRVHAAFVIGTFSTVFAAWTRRLNGQCFDSALSATEVNYAASAINEQPGAGTSKPTTGGELYYVRSEIAEMVRWPSEAVDRQAVPTAWEGHRTKPQIMTASGI